MKKTVVKLSDDESKDISNSLENGKLYEKTLGAKTLMAQYLRAKAFKTSGGKLSWKQFSSSRLSLYNTISDEV